MTARTRAPRPAARHRHRRKAWFWRRLWRKISRRIKGRMKRFVGFFTEERTVLNWKRDGWKRAYPNPRRPVPPTLVQVDSASREEYLATFDGELVVEFWVYPHPQVKLDDAAYEAAQQAHGPIVQSWVLTCIEAANGPAQAVLPEPLWR